MIYSKLLLIVVLVLASCTNIQVERCMVDTDHFNCYCHEYVIKRGEVGRVSETVIKPLDYCDKFISFSPEDWALIYAQLSRYLVNEN
ncbi:MAG: hypothetical protein U9O94_00465 [Nanoarchaeota archaeon]|nr:hypothetical protein [Nanoarchaeota archaeon]